MKKTIAIILSLIIVMTVVLAGCGNSASNTNKDSNDVETTVEKTEEETTEPPTEALVNSYEEYNDFSDGLAWVKYNNSNGDYYGCIKKKKKMQFNVSANSVKSVKPYSNGYSYIEYESQLDVIDKKGNITKSYNSDEEHTILAFGDGYVMTQDYKADFDSKGYTVTIYNPDGSEITSKKFDDRIPYDHFYYCGKGLFELVDQVSSQMDDDDEILFYSIAKEKWIDWEIDNDFTWVNSDLKFFDENTNNALINIYYKRDTGYNFRIIDNECNHTDYKFADYDNGIGYLWREEPYPLSESNIIFNCGSDEFTGLFIYGLKDKKMITIPEKYKDKVIMEMISQPCVVDSGVFALPLRGEDEKTYLMVFNEKWETVLEATEIESYKGFSCGRAIVNTDTETLVYNSEGKVAFNASDLGYSDVQRYSDDVARVADQYEPTYLDKDGKVLFEEIDDSTSY